jgi:hypothetical protein
MLTIKPQLQEQEEIFYTYLSPTKRSMPIPSYIFLGYSKIGKPLSPLSEALMVFVVYVFALLHDGEVTTRKQGK